MEGQGLTLHTFYKLWLIGKGLQYKVPLKETTFRFIGFAVAF